MGTYIDTEINLKFIEGKVELKEDFAIRFVV